MPTPMEKVTPTAADELFEILLAECVTEVSKLLELGPINALSLVARWAGDRAGCIDSLMQENHEFRIQMCNPGMDHLVGERDTIELVEANIKLAYDLHVEKHKRRTTEAIKHTDELLKSVLEKGRDK